MSKKLTKGEQVIIDADMTNSGLVRVVSQTPNRMFTTVIDSDNAWSVMTRRLTKIFDKDE